MLCQEGKKERKGERANIVAPSLNVWKNTKRQHQIYLLILYLNFKLSTPQVHKKLSEFADHLTYVLYFSFTTWHMNNFHFQFYLLNTSCCYDSQRNNQMSCFWAKKENMLLCWLIRPDSWRWEIPNKQSYPPNSPVLSWTCPQIKFLENWYWS